MEKAAEMYTKGFCMIARRQLSTYVSFIVLILLIITKYTKNFSSSQQIFIEKALYIELFTTYILIVTHSPLLELINIAE